ncbi:MAG: hypothetical protein ACREM3_24550 [Candidatus Rokuibacteriota bacterium]
MSTSFGRPAHSLAPLVALTLVCSVLSGASAARPAPSLPADLPQGERARCLAIAEAAAVSARVEAEPFVVRREVFEFLLDHPPFATHVTRALGVARYRIWRDAEGLHLDDGWGTTGRFEVVHTAPGTRVFIARGEYNKRFLPTIEGEAVTMIEYRAEPRPDGRALLRSTVSGFLRLDNRLATLAMKAMNGIAQRKADKEAKKLMRVFAKTSRRLDEDPAGALERLRRQPDVPRAELEAFARLLSAR